MEPGWSNATFEAYLCGNLSAVGHGDSITIMSSVSLGDYYTLPGCLYGIADSLNYFKASYVHFAGRAGLPDPMDRFLSSHPALTSLTLSYFSLADNVDIAAIIDWNAVFDRAPLLNTLSLTYSRHSIGTLPSIPLPSSIGTFSIYGCGITGTISSSLFANTPSGGSIYFQVAHNQLIGNIPASLFSLYDSSVYSLQFSVNDNQLNGTIPANLFSAPLIASVKWFQFDISNNGLVGPLGNLLDGYDFTDGTISTFKVLASSNQLTGAIPMWHTSKCSSVTVFQLVIADNLLSDVMPSNLISGAGFSANIPQVTINLRNNSLRGQLPPLLFAPEGTPSSTSPSLFTLLLDGNQLAGTLPADYFDYYDWTATANALFNFGDNDLTGDLPAKLFHRGNTARLKSLTVDFSDNPHLNGTIPSSFFSSLLDSVASTVQLTGTIACRATGLTGTVALPNLSLRAQPFLLTFDGSHANFTSLSLPTNSAVGLAQIILRDNPHLSGTLPDALFSSTSDLSLLQMSNTAISGTMPRLDTLPSPKLDLLDLSATNIEFCGEDRGIWSRALAGCNFQSTNASLCAELYPSCQTTPSPSATPISPPAAPSSSQCPLATRPSDDFVCVNGIWTSIGTISTPVLTIPPGSTQTLIIGNVTSPNIIINGIGSTVIIQQGCATNLSTITIQLTEDDLKKLGPSKSQVLLSFGNSTTSCGNLNSVDVQLKLKGGSDCRKVKVSRVVSETSISALFNIDKSSCRTWWIVLVSVICGVIVLAVVVFVLLAIFCRPVRYFIRPYSKPRGPNAPNI